MATGHRAALLCASKKGISSNQLHRTLGITLKSAWFLSHRIREAMRGGDLAPLGGAGNVVEMDETYFDNKEVVTKRTIRGKSGHGSKRSIVALVERGGEVRSFHVENADRPTVNQIVAENIGREARLDTDESRLYGDAKARVAAHETVRHSAAAGRDAGGLRHDQQRAGAQPDGEDGGAVADVVGNGAA